MGARIGVGCTTYKRPKHYETWCNQIEKFGGEDYLVVGVADVHDGERKGIAYRKNECLKILKDCDYIFLFDDDCFPVKNGWAEFFIEASKASGQQHFLYLKETPTIKKIETVILNEPYKENGWEIKIDSYNNCAGCMMFLTKEVIEKVGGYGQYGIYGYEHAGYSERIHQAGLTPLGKYTCPAGVDEFIYAMDYCFDKPFNKQVNHEPSLKNELHKVESYIKEGVSYFQQDIQQIYRPL